MTRNNHPVLNDGDYLTDEANLFRFEGFLPEAEGAILEDAWTGRVWTVPLSDFAQMRLRRVELEESHANG